MRTSKTPRLKTSYAYRTQDFDSFKLKIIDFGFARISKRNRRVLKDFLGTPYYMAPEIINYSPYGTEVDIWSLGVLVFYFIEFDFPFKGKDKK